LSQIIRQPWSRDELILAVNLYCKTPFGKIHVRNPDIIALAKSLKRTSGSVSYKLANFACIDPSLPRKGASNVSKLDKQVWNDFFENWDEMAYRSEVELSRILNVKPIDEQEEINIPEGKTKATVTKTRVNQSFFRKAVLSSYEYCCITGISIPELLVASHIVPWAIDCKNRTNPRNGLCLNYLHDKAFDSGFITISDDFTVTGSSRLLKHPTKGVNLITDFIGKKIELPRRFCPDPNFLAYHREKIFQP